MKKIVIVLVLLLVIAYFGVSTYIVHEMTKPTPGKPEISRDSISLDSEDISFKASDGINIKGWLFGTSSDSQKLVIMVPGVYENRVNTPYSASEIAKMLLTNGYDVLLYDPRGIGESEQVRLTFASKDYKDILGAISFAEKKGFKKSDIAILGDSLGAISTVFASPEFEGVGALIADSPASTLEPLVTRQLKNDKKIPGFLVPGIYFMGKLVFGVDIPSVRPIDSIVKVSERRFLFLHGEKDTFIPIKNSQDLLAKANKKSKLVIFKDAEHVDTFKTDPELYIKEVLQFLQEELK